jgi:hypothetical protein
MSAQDVELIGRVHRAWNGGDMAMRADVFDADVELRPAGDPFALPSASWHHRSGVARRHPAPPAS